MKKLFFILGLLSFFDAYAECDSNGKCVWDCSPDQTNPTCTATFENGTLTISGTQMKESFSEIRNPQRNNTFVTLAPWREHIDDITNFVLDKRITAIGAKFLTGATQLKNIIIPDHVIQIGRDAFAGVKAESILIGDNVEFIDEYGLWTAQMSTIYCRDTLAHQCKDLINTNNSGSNNLVQYLFEGDRYIANGNKYKNLYDMQNGINQVKRIYTIEEANAIAGKSNTFSIRYR